MIFNIKKILISIGLICSTVFLGAMIYKKVTKEQAMHSNFAIIDYPPDKLDLDASEFFTGSTFRELLADQEEFEAKLMLVRVPTVLEDGSSVVSYYDAYEFHQYRFGEVGLTLPSEVVNANDPQYKTSVIAENIYYYSYDPDAPAVIHFICNYNDIFKQKNGLFYWLTMLGEQHSDTELRTNAWEKIIELCFTKEVPSKFESKQYEIAYPYAKKLIHQRINPGSKIYGLLSLSKLAPLGVGDFGQLNNKSRLEKALELAQSAEKKAQKHGYKEFIDVAQKIILKLNDMLRETSKPQNEEEKKIEAAK